MKKIKISVLLILASVTLTLDAQKIRWESGGKLPFLKNEKFINTEYDYSNMSVGRFDREEEYVNEKVTEYNNKEKGKGDKWKKNWMGDRKAFYEPKFEELINKYTEKKEMLFSKKEGTKITLVLHTVKTEPGFNVGVMKKPAYCDFEITFVDTKSKEVLAKGYIKNVPGSQFSGYDYDVASRVAESYAKAGKVLGKYIEGILK